MIQDYKIMLVKQEWRAYSEEGDVPELKVEEVSMEKLLENEEVRRELERLGWKDVKKITDLETKLTLAKKFFILASFGGASYNQAYQIDIDKLQPHQVHGLANNSVIVQQVELKTVLSEEQYKRVQKERKAIEEQKKQTQAAANRRLERKKAKEIENAKKMLEQHGLRVLSDDPSEEAK